MKTGNLLIDSLTEKTRQKVLAVSDIVILNNAEILYADNNVKHVYFPIKCLISARDNGMELYTVGNEGVTPISAIWGITSTKNDFVVCCPGTAIKMKVYALEALIDYNKNFKNLLFKYANDLIQIITQLVSTQYFSTIEQRLIGWILNYLNKTDVKVISITHDELSKLLGCGRSPLTLVAIDLKQKGLIDYKRGKLKVLDHESLSYISSNY